MKVLAVFLAAIACAVADPAFLFRGDLPYFYNDYYRSIIDPYLLTRNVIPTTLPYITPYLKSQYYDRDFIGQARYGHIEPGQTHHAVQDAFGNKVGGYSYYDAEGKLVQTSYVADGAGFRVATNNLPVDKLVAPLPVEDTPEVKAARIAHLEEIEKVKSRSRRDILVDPVVPHIVSPIVPHIDYRFTIPHALPTTKVEPVVRKDGFLEDTPEVKFAKELHFSEVEAAKFRNLAPIPSYPFIKYPYDYRYLHPIYRF